MTEESKEIEIVKEKSAIDVKNAVDVEELNKIIELCLDHMGLPSENIFASTKERRNVFLNFPLVAESIKPEVRESSYYLSKFFASIAVGLFDAALNYLWDAIVENLRQKIIKFDVGYFFDSHPNINIRSSDKRDIEGLTRMSEQELLDGSMAIGIISNVIYQEISLIKYMRNHASAAHPNINEIKGLSLIGWLDACNKGLFEKEFPTAAVEAKKFIVNIKNHDSLSEQNIKYAKKSLSTLKTNQIDSLLKALFGLYVDSASTTYVRNNVFHFASSLWQLSSDVPKNQIGIQYAHYSANQEEQKTKLTKQFLEKVDGLSYLPDDIRVIELENLVQNLRDIHYSANNFYNEPEVASRLRKYVSEARKIPKQVRKDYVKTIILCRIGNSSGVSWSAIADYDYLINLFDTDEIIEFCNLILDQEIISEVNSKYYKSQNDRFLQIAEILKPRASGQLEEFLDIMLAKKDIALLHKFGHIRAHLDKINPK